VASMNYEPKVTSRAALASTSIHPIIHSGRNVRRQRQVELCKCGAANTEGEPHGPAARNSAGFAPCRFCQRIWPLHSIQGRVQHRQVGEFLKSVLQCLDRELRTNSSYLSGVVGIVAIHRHGHRRESTDQRRMRPRDQPARRAHALARENRFGGRAPSTGPYVTDSGRNWGLFLRAAGLANIFTMVFRRSAGWTIGSLRPAPGMAQWIRNCAVRRRS